MLLDAKADLNARNSDGATALIVASENGHADVVRVLLDAKADVNAKDNYGGTAPMLASQSGHADVVRVLLAAKVDVNAKTSEGRNRVVSGVGEVVAPPMWCARCSLPKPM